MFPERRRGNSESRGIEEIAIAFLMEAGDASAEKRDARCAPETRGEY